MRLDNSRVLSVLVLTGLVFFTGCAAAGPVMDGTPPSQPSEGPKRGGTLRFSGADPAHLDPADTVGQALHSQGPGIAYGRLLRYAYRTNLPDLSAEVAPDLAERWEQVDPTTYVFHIRKGVKFHDVAPVNGRDVTVEDIVYSLNRQREPGRASAGQLANVDDLRAGEGSTVRVTIKRADPDFLVELTDPRNQVVAREAVALTGDLKNGPTIGSGPFILEKYEKGGGSSFVRNPKYYDGSLPRLDGFEIFTSLTDPAAELAAFRTGRIDVLDVSPQNMELVTKQHPQVKVQRNQRPTSQILSIKQDRPPFNNVKVRQAVSKAVDRQQVLDTAWGGLGWLHAGLNAGREFFLPEDEVKQRLKRDLPEAKKLLAEAGYPSGFAMEIIVGANAPEDLSAAELMVPQLKEAGINATLQVVDYPRYLQQVATRGDFTSAGYGNYSSLPTTNATLIGLYTSGGQRNVNGIKDPKLDQMIAEQSVMQDREQRKKAVHEIQRYLLDNAYLLVIHANINQTVLWPHANDWMGGLLSDGIRYAHVWSNK